MNDTQQVEPWLITVKQAAKLFCLGTTTLYEMISYEHFPVVRFGRAVRIDPVQARQWLDQRKREQQSA